VLVEVSKSKKSDRERLLEARADIQRQIEILEAGPLIPLREGGSQFDPLIAKLTSQLKDIDDSLAALGEDDDQKP
jgi:hypothetical protein